LLSSIFRGRLAKFLRPFKFPDGGAPDQTTSAADLALSCGDKNPLSISARAAPRASVPAFR